MVINEAKMSDIPFLQAMLNFTVHFEKSNISKKPRHIQTGWDTLECSLTGLESDCLQFLGSPPCRIHLESKHRIEQPLSLNFVAGW